MKETIRSFFVLKAIFITSTVLVIGSFLWAFFSLRHISQPIIVLFTPFEIESIGSMWSLLWIALFGLGVSITNAFIGRELFFREKRLAYFASAVAIFVASLIFYTFWAIIDVNI